MYAVEITGLTFSFNRQILFRDFDFTLPQGEWTALLGHSGIGKSTLLRIIAGLEPPQQGSIQFPQPTEVAWLAQQDSLFPWLSVLDNVQLGAHLTGNKNAQSRAKAEQMLAAVKMAEHQHKACYQLSGGQRQRVALARTLMSEADLILMDEPFSALDAVTRFQLQELAYGLLAEKTVLLITHDPQEAIRLADNIYVLQHRPARLSEVIRPLGSAPRDRHQPQLWTLEQQLFQRLTEGGDD